MTNNERDLLNIIREDDNPEEALEISINIILSFLEQHESSQLPMPVCLQALC